MLTILNREKLFKIAHAHAHTRRKVTRSELDRRGIGFSEYFSAGIPFSSFFQTAAISRVITVIPARAVIEREQKRRLIALGRNHPGGRGGKEGGAPLFLESHLWKGLPFLITRAANSELLSPNYPRNLGSRGCIRGIVFGSTVSSGRGGCV